MPDSEIEHARLASLRARRILDTEPETEYDALVRAASLIAGSPIALVSLVDERRQWFKARVGLAAAETPRDVAFCSVAIERPDEALVIPDATADPRFAANPLVVGDPSIRFYAGFPLRDHDGNGLGTLCVIDRSVRRLGDDQLSALRDLADVAESLMNHRLSVEALERARHAAGVTNAALAQAEVRLRKLFEVTPDLMVMIDTGGDVVAANPVALEMMGRLADEIVGTEIGTLGCDAVFDAGAIEAIGGVLRDGSPREIERTWLEPEGRPEGWYRFRVLPIGPQHGSGRSGAGVLVIATDITPAVIEERRLSTMAFTDPLTKVGNRAAFFDRLGDAMLQLDWQHRRGGVAVAMLDLDHFKALNDTYGHETGDRALVSAASSIRRGVRHEDTVARIGGDEFAVLFEDVASPAEAERLAVRLNTALAATLIRTIDGERAVPGSVGLTWTGARVDATDLLARADRALYQAKSQKRGSVVVDDPGLERGPFLSTSDLHRDLADARRLGQLEFRYQPIVTPDGVLASAEALLRWNHPEHGLLTPPVFLRPLLETGMITEVGWWGIDTAAAQIASWVAAGVEPVPIHVNLSPAEMANTRLAQVVEDVITARGIDPALLCIEMTEQALDRNAGHEVRIGELGRLGVRIALDDFGTGTSSLVHLRQQPLHMIKLDRGFVARLEQHHEDRSILKAVISAGRDLGLDIAAEGVETIGQHDWLVEVGCTHLQGWMHGRPGLVDELGVRRMPEALVSP